MGRPAEDQRGGGEEAGGVRRRRMPAALRAVMWASAGAVVCVALWAGVNAALWQVAMNRAAAIEANPGSWRWGRLGRRQLTVFIGSDARSGNESVSFHAEIAWWGEVLWGGGQSRFGDATRFDGQIFGAGPMVPALRLLPENADGFPGEVRVVSVGWPQRIVARVDSQTPRVPTWSGESVLLRGPIIVSIIGVAAFGGGGVMVLMGLARVWRSGMRMARLGRSLCDRCGYPREGLPAGSRCPECGAGVPRRRVIARGACIASLWATLGVFLAMNGSIVARDAHLRVAVSDFPPDYLMLSTDMMTVLIGRMETDPRRRWGSTIFEMRRSPRTERIRLLTNGDEPPLKPAAGWEGRLRGTAWSRELAALVNEHGEEFASRQVEYGWPRGVWVDREWTTFSRSRAEIGPERRRGVSVRGLAYNIGAFALTAVVIAGIVLIPTITPAPTPKRRNQGGR